MFCPYAVDYLGKEESNLTINFKRPGSMITAQVDAARCMGRRYGSVHGQPLAWGAGLASRSNN